MFSNNKYIDERLFLLIIAIGTLLIYLITPTPNILYREEADANSKNIINFGENTDCYGVKTTEVECPLENKSNKSNKSKQNVSRNLPFHLENNNNNNNNNNVVEEIPHNLSMNIREVTN